jgi:ubiquinone/menaquinone biosynthesis C-methylase UbiE
MDFEQLAKIENESERVNRTYDIFNEDARLNHSKAARVEFLTTVHYIEKYLKDGDKILDIGAGAGEYSLYFARKGYEVSALELADANIAAFKKKLTPEDKIDLVQGNALDLSRYADKSFDIVLLFGPLYHLKNDADKQKCISEAKRVCKDGGKIFFAFIPTTLFSSPSLDMTLNISATVITIRKHSNLTTFRLCSTRSVRQESFSLTAV